MLPLLVPLMVLVAIAAFWAQRSNRRYRAELRSELAAVQKHAESLGARFRLLSDPGVYEIAPVANADHGVRVRGYRQRDRGARLKGVVRCTELVWPAEPAGNAADAGSAGSAAGAAAALGAPGGAGSARARWVLLCVPAAELDRIGDRAPDDWIGRMLLVEPLLGRDAAAIVRGEGGGLRRLRSDAAEGFACWGSRELWELLGDTTAVIRAAEAVCRRPAEILGRPGSVLLTLDPQRRTVDTVILRIPEFVSSPEMISALVTELEHLRGVSL